MCYLSYLSIVHADIIQISFLDVFNKKKIKSEMMSLIKKLGTSCKHIYFCLIISCKLSWINDAPYCILFVIQYLKYLFAQPSYFIEVWELAIKIRHISLEFLKTIICFVSCATICILSPSTYSNIFHKITKKFVLKLFQHVCFLHVFTIFSGWKQTVLH